MSDIVSLSVAHMGDGLSAKGSIERIEGGESLKTFAVTDQISSRLSFPENVFLLDQRTFFPSTSRHRAEEIYEKTLRFLHELDEPILH